MTDSTFLIGGEHAGDRLMRQQALTSPSHLGDESPPTPRQVAAVLHALSDHTHLKHILSDDVTRLAADRPGPNQQADAIGRYLQAIADYLRSGETENDGLRRLDTTQRWPLGTSL